MPGAPPALLPPGDTAWFFGYFNGSLRDRDESGGPAQGLVVIVIVIIIIIVIILVVVVLGVDLACQHVLDPLLQLCWAGQVVLVHHLQPHAVGLGTPVGGTWDGQGWGGGAHAVGGSRGLHGGGTWGTPRGTGQAGTPAPRGCL